MRQGLNQCKPARTGVCNQWTGELDWSTGLEHWTGVLECQTKRLKIVLTGGASMH